MTNSDNVVKTIILLFIISLNRSLKYVNFCFKCLIKVVVTAPIIMEIDL